MKRFDELAARFPIEQETDNADAVYALPEFAYASAKTGDPLHLESYLKALPAGTVFFELALGHAYFKAVEHHDNTGALADLQQAAVLIEHHMGRTPRVEYQYANAAERIYRETGDMRFRERALGWCHLMQQLEPWAGWAYWIEVELSENMTERRAALVKAMFLDSQSPRLKSVSTADADWARAQLQRGNPFLREQQGKRTTL